LERRHSKRSSAVPRPPVAPLFIFGTNALLTRAAADAAPRCLAPRRRLHARRPAHRSRSPVPDIIFGL